MKTFFILLFCCFTCSLWTQSYTTENRKGGLFFSVGSEYRITPIYPMGTFNNDIASATNIDLQSSGVAFNYAFNYFVTKNLSLGFANTIRYDLVTLADNITTDFGYRVAHNDFIFGFHFYADYHFQIFKEGELVVRLGKSLLNRGTEFRSKETFYDDEGNVLFSVYSQLDAGYEPWNFAIGYKKKKVFLLLGAYTSSISEYVNADFIVPYVKFSYNLGKL